jgi:hypothetical protein
MSRQAQFMALAVGAVVALVPLGLWLAAIWVADDTSTPERLTVTGWLIAIYAVAVGGVGLIIGQDGGDS